MLLNPSSFHSFISSHPIPHCVLATTSFSLSLCFILLTIFMEAYHEDRVKKSTGVVVEKNHEEEEEEEEEEKLPTPSSASPVSSPAHEFSFTISLHSSGDKSRPPPASFAIDLSPADDIFFHGHLLPLHFLSHIPVSPRSSTDSFTLPIRDLLEEQQRRVDGSCNAAAGDKHHHQPHQREPSLETKIKSKLKSFSFFGLKNWQRKAQKTEDPRQRHTNNTKQKRKLGLSQVVKRYVRLVRAPLFSRRREKLDDLRRQPYSFSGDLLVKNRHDLRGRYSAPASMRTSPTNSGHLVATTTSTTTASLSSSTSDSTMEELQAAIQAAIAHCKNSIALEPRQQIS